MKDKEISKTIEEIRRKEETLPGTFPSIKSMIIDFIKRKNEEGERQVSLAGIYEELENVVKEKNLTERYKMDTFRNSIRGELNTHEQNSNHKSNLNLFERIEKGFYSLTDNRMR